MSLVPDSSHRPALAGARSELESRHLVLKIHNFDVHVRMLFENENCQILGQIQPRGGAAPAHSARLHLIRNGERISSTQANELGEFRFSYVPEGPLSLQIELTDMVAVAALDWSRHV